MNLLSLFRDPLGRVSFGKVTLFVGAAFLVQATPAFGAEDPILVGTSVSFVASAEGSPAPTYQWWKNGNPIAGATNQTLTISAATLADAGKYQVVATNNLGNAASPEEELVVQSVPSYIEPSFTTQPEAAQNVTTGGSITLTVAAAGTPAPTYQWFKNGAMMVGRTNATLTLTSVSSGDTGTYAAVASNIAGSVTSSATVLTVVAEPVVNNPPPTQTTVAPTITSQPAVSQTVAAGGSVSFSVSVSGTPAPILQWYKNGIAVSGATNATLTLSNLTGSDSGIYGVVAMNSAGTVQSNNATLTVTELVVTNPPPQPPVSSTTSPSFTTQPSNQTVVAGSGANLTAAASGSPTPTYQWRKNGAKIAGATNATLSIRSVTSADAASYSVAATNSAGTVVSDTAVLTVHTKPVITLQPAPQAVEAGGAAKFSVTAAAIPGATYQWRKNGIAIAGATGATLTIASVSSTDAGSYSVVATNSIGSTPSNSAALVLSAPPIVTRQPVSQLVLAKSNVTFSVAASGSPTPTYQWKKNGANINGATSATLTLKSVTRADEGVYTVVASNLVGWVSSSKAALTVVTLSGGRSDGDVEGGSGSVDTSVESRLVNLSVRATAGTGNDNLIVGFVVDGAAAKPVLIRGIGPTLRDFGVAGALVDPNLALYAGANVTASNDDWMTNENAAIIPAMSAQVGAFGLPDRTADAALVTTLPAGAYTAQLNSKDAAGGVALVEVYDAASGNAAKLVNLSVRAKIGGASESPNVGFVIAGNSPKRVLIRAVGPTLGAFGVTGAIADPQLEVFQGATRIDGNDNWGGDEALRGVFAQVGAFGFSDASSRDAVLFAVLAPGAYTVVVSGVNGSSGVGLVELYEVP